MEQHSILPPNKMSSVTEFNLEAGDVTGVLSGTVFLQHFIQQGRKTCKISLSLKFPSKVWQFVIDSKMKVDTFSWKKEHLLLQSHG